VRGGIAVDAVEGFVEVAGQGVGGGDDVVTGLDLDGAVAVAVRTNFLIDQPVRSSVHRLTGVPAPARAGPVAETNSYNFGR
jgi:hypothetical protein